MIETKYSLCMKGNILFTPKKIFPFTITEYSNSPKGNIPTDRKDIYQLKPRR